jgi:hypothetical protein
MNDELDTLRSFRPEAAGPTDALQLQERTAFMETLAHAPTRPRRRMPRFGPRRRVFVGIAIAVVTVVGTAGAAGMIPGDVQQALGLAAAHAPDAALTPQIDQAMERASTPTSDGGTLELWTAPTDGGGTCAYLRQLDATGASTDSGPISCAVSIAGGGRMGTEMSGQSSSPPAGGSMRIGGALADGQANAQIQVDANGAATLFGQVPGSATNVQVVDSSGTVLGRSAASDGWFVLTLPAGTASRAASLFALSASGASLDAVPIGISTPPPPPTGDGSQSGSAPA